MQIIITRKSTKNFSSFQIFLNEKLRANRYTNNYVADPQTIQMRLLSRKKLISNES